MVLLAQACGSEDGKKKSPPSKFTPGEGGENAGGNPNAGGGETTAGTAGSSGSGATSGNGAGGEPTTPGGDGGATGMTGEAGMPSTGDAGMPGVNGGAGGATDPGSDCPTGKDECDGNPLTVCEQSLNLVTSCGACNVTCQSTNASVICDPVELECKITDCNAGFGSCDGNEANGCETNLVSNAEHCGSCNRDCAALGSTCATNRCDKVTLQQNISLGATSWAFGPSGAFHMGYYDYIVRRLPLDGAAPVTIWDPVNKTAGMESLLVNGTDVFWAERGTGAFTSALLKKSVTDSAATLPTLVFTPEYQPTYLRIQGNAFYWMSGDYQSGDPAGYVYTRALNAAQNEPGTRIVNVDQGNHGAVLAFATTSDALYWVTSSALNGAANELRTTPLAGGTPVPVPPVAGAGTVTAVNSGYGVPVLQAVGDTIYFNRNVGTDAKNGIYKFKTGDAQPTLVTTAEDINTMIVDDEFVYYASQNVTGIFKAPLTGGAGVQISDGAWTRIVGQEGKFLYAYGYGANNMYKVIK